MLKKRPIRQAQDKQTKQKRHSKLFLILPGIFLLFGLAFIGVLASNIRILLTNDSSLTGDEAKEISQNTIPNDVQAFIKTQNNVLGSYTFGNIQYIAPKELHVPILMYHYVEYIKDPLDKVRNSLTTSPASLEQEIKTLSDAKYTFMTMSDLLDVFEGKRIVPSNPVLLTFDDGYRDFYTDAYPILKKYNAKATQFVITGFLDYPNHLLTSQLKEIAQDGLVEIGAHTVHHVWLKGQTLKTVTYEVSESKKVLEQLIGKPVTSFAYPYGAFDAQAVKAVAGSGFQIAVSTVPGIDQQYTNKYFLYRLRPGGLSGQNLITWLNNIKNN